MNEPICTCGYHNPKVLGAVHAADCPRFVIDDLEEGSETEQPAFEQAVAHAVKVFRRYIQGRAPKLLLQAAMQEVETTQESLLEARRYEFEHQDDFKGKTP